MVLQIQIWSPGFDAAVVVLGMTQALLGPLLLSDLGALQRDRPLLLLYADPGTWMEAAEPAEPAEGGSALLAALPELVAAGHRCRLVNLSRLSLPALVAWCVDPASPPPPESSLRFREPKPFEALLAHCSDLQLSFQAQQQDLEQLAVRLALLEQLVGQGSDASLRLQTRLAQAIA